MPEHESEVDRAREADGYLKEATPEGKQRAKLCVEMNRARGLWDRITPPFAPLFGGVSGQINHGTSHAQTFQSFSVVQTNHVEQHSEVYAASGHFWRCAEALHVHFPKVQRFFRSCARPQGIPVDAASYKLPSQGASYIYARRGDILELHVLYDETAALLSQVALRIPFVAFLVYIDVIADCFLSLLQQPVIPQGPDGRQFTMKYYESKLLPAPCPFPKHPKSQALFFLFGVQGTSGTQQASGTTQTPRARLQRYVWQSSSQVWIRSHGYLLCFDAETPPPLLQPFLLACCFIHGLPGHSSLTTQLTAKQSVPLIHTRAVQVTPMKYMDGTPFLKKPKSIPAAPSANALKPEGMVPCCNVVMFFLVGGENMQRGCALCCCDVMLRTQHVCVKCNCQCTYACVCVCVCVYVYIHMRKTAAWMCTLLLRCDAENRACMCEM
jgi:hypothetical protein